MEDFQKKCVELIRQQHALMIVIATSGLALIEPSYGAKGGPLHYEIVIPTCIVAIFLTIGMVLPADQLANGTRAVSFHIMCQSYSLLVMPFSYYILVYYWKWDQMLDILSTDFSKGVMAALCMPTTAFTCVMFTRQAGGDESVAVCNAALGNLLGPLVSPVVAHLFLGGHSSMSILKEAFKLGWQLVLPLIAGLAIQFAVIQHNAELIPVMVKWARFVFDIILVVVLYFIFCEGFHAEPDSITAVSVSLMVVWVTVVHICAFVGAWYYASPFSPKRRVALMFVASQKTEGMAIAILAIISNHSGALIMPVVVYHTVQMAFAASICPSVKRYLASLEGYCTLGDDDEAVPVCQRTGHVGRQETVL
eukprot:TRINITY_DN1830_c0_g2_i1.p1 TRINITY_DN1830_c0_g2~~TRINITY_DN1830_c0_g2_i1.p1  ORF type:complete len:364 (+),score=71.21 TRINITY_DN1830_c0_g2_i1:30-1121(+)